jgi:hypothetical protein
MRDLTGLVLWTLCGLIGVPAAKRKMATKTDGKPPFALACRAASIISPANTFTVPSPSRDRPHVSGCQTRVVSLVEEQRRCRAHADDQREIAVALRSTRTSTTVPSRMSRAIGSSASERAFQASQPSPCARPGSPSPNRAFTRGVGCDVLHLAAHQPHGRGRICRRAGRIGDRPR